MEQTRNALGLGNTRQIVYEDFPPSSDWTHDANCHVLLIDLPGFKREELKVRVDTQRKVTVSGERQVSENKYSRFKQIYELPEDSDVDSISGRFDNGLLFVIIPKIKTAPANEIEEEKKAEKPGKEEVHDKQKHEKPKEEPKKDVISDEKKDEKREEEPKKDDDNKKPKEESKWSNMKGSLPAVDRKKIEEDMRKMAERVKSKEELEIMIRSAMDKIRKNKTVIITAVLAFSLGLYISRKYQSGGD